MDKKQRQRVTLCCLVLVAITVCSAAVKKDATKSVERRSHSSGCGKADIVFLVDTSGSIGETNFNKTLEFIQDVVLYSSSIGPNALQIGVDTFSSSFHSEIGLDDYRYSYSLRRAIGSIRYRGGGTAMATALTSLSSISFSTYAGHRVGVSKTGVIVTDGKANSNSAAIAAANSTKNAGIYLLVVGVGSSVDSDELNSIASEPSSKNVFNAYSHGSLYSVARGVANRLCAVCHGQVDVVFLIDKSTSLTGRIFNDTLTMIVDVVSNSDVGSNDVMFGVDTFDTVYRQEIALAEYNSKSSLVRAVQNIGYQSGGGTNTALGLFGMKTVSFSSEAGHRPRAAKVGIVVTDGESLDKPATRAAASAARSAGIQMVVVGVGSPSYTELYYIATSRSYVYTGTSYSTRARLRTLISNIKNNC